MLSQRHGYAALAPPPCLRHSQSCVLSIIFQGDIFLADHWPTGPGVCSTRQTTTSSPPWAPPVAAVNSRTHCALAKRKHGDLFLRRCCPCACVRLCLVLQKYMINSPACSECWEKSEMISLRCLGGGVLKESTCVLRGSILYERAVYWNQVRSFTLLHVLQVWTRHKAWKVCSVRSHTAFQMVYLMKIDERFSIWTSDIKLTMEVCFSRGGNGQLWLIIKKRTIKNKTIFI